MKTGIIVSLFVSENENFKTRWCTITAGFEGLKPVRAPSWLRDGEVAESGMVPRTLALTASFAPPRFAPPHPR